MSGNYTAYHVHTELSLLDSATKFEDYIAKAVELGQTAIAFTEHGNIYQWVAKKIACDKAGLKYLHGCEVYLTEKLLLTDPRTGEQNKVRDNYHTILIAKNYTGLQEMNELISRSSQDDHFYYKPRITFDEFLGISSNVIKISACLASPLNRMSITHPMYERLLKHYDYLEIQAHDHPEQVAYNRHLAEMSQKYDIPLIAGTDTHSLNKYKAECRTILQLSKHIEFADEDTFDLIKDAYELLGKPYPKSHEINWNDEAVWKDMLRSPIGIFQFEGEFAFQMLRQYEPHSIFDMSLVTAALRPSGASYRDDLMQHKPHKNPSPIIDELLADNNGYLIYQEDVIKFLQQICGFSGSDADNTRRAIGRKDEERLKKALPQILEGYCEKSPQPREVAEQEAKEFLQIIQDASSYMFGYNHSVGYCMIGYLCAYLRYYHPYEFITAYLTLAWVSRLGILQCWILPSPDWTTWLKSVVFTLLPFIP